MMLLALALISAPPAVQPAAPPPAPATTVAADPARIAAAQRVLDITHIEQQYDHILTQMIPVMSAQIFGSLKDNLKLPADLRAYFADSANVTTASGLFAEEAAKSFKARYPQMRLATAREYARIFTADELTALAAFYTTPLGQKALSSLPELQTKLMPIGMAAGSEAGREAMTRVIERLGLGREAPPKS